MEIYINIDPEDSDVLWGKGMADSKPVVQYSGKFKFDYPILTIMCFTDELKREDKYEYRRAHIKTVNPAKEVLNNCGYQLKQGEMILYKDGNIFNLSRSNLAVFNKNNPLLVEKFKEVSGINGVYFNAWGNNYAVYLKGQLTFDHQNKLYSLYNTVSEARSVAVGLKNGLNLMEIK